MTSKDKIVCHMGRDMKVHAAQRAATRPHRLGGGGLAQSRSSTFFSRGRKSAKIGRKELMKRSTMIYVERTVR